MGSPYREPRPQSPERLRLKSIDFAGFDRDTGELIVQVSFNYDTWCCSNSHEIIDAILAVSETFEAASTMAEEERLKNLHKEYEGVLDESDL
jgi:hypothetical protein